MSLRKLFFAVLMISSTAAAAKPAEYFFCVESSGFETFKAHVIFRSVDFGETAARQMVFNDVKKHLGEDVIIRAFDISTCPCQGDCAVLEVSAKDWDGNVSDNSNSTSTVVGSAAEMLDKFIYETQELLTDPGGFLKRQLFGTTGN